MTTKKSRFCESLKSELGDLQRRDDDQGPNLIISDKYLARMDEQLEKAVVVKLMGRSMGYKMLCNRINILWKPAVKYRVIDLENDFFIV